MRKAIIALGTWLLLSTTALTFLAWEDPLKLVAVKMWWGFIICWIFIGGSVMYLSRNYFWNFYSKISWPFWIKFTVFATIFALIEEGVAVGINNFFYEAGQGKVMLTASTNYWEVVSQHSVVVFIPIFLLLSLFVKKFELSPNKTFIIFGIIGVLAEMSIGGAFALLSFGLWFFVYGLMVYLPAYSNTDDL